jgi:hypothetical protein
LKRDKCKKDSDDDDEVEEELDQVGELDALDGPNID